jgi:tetratricopeptide (TPR) repeat protein
MNDQNYHTIFNLVSDYESKSKDGSASFLDEKAFLQLVEFYNQEGHFHKSLEVIDHALNIHHYSSELYIKKAEIFLELGMEAEALEVLNQAAVFSPSEDDIILLKTEALIYLGAFLEAESWLDQLKMHYENDIQSKAFFLEGLLYEQTGQNERMYYSLIESLRYDGTNQDALEHLWLCIELEKKYKESIEFFEELLSSNAYSSQIWFYLGHCHAYLGNYESAIEAYEYSYIIDPAFEDGYRECGELCYETKNFSKALNVLLQLEKMSEPDPDVLLRIGQCYQGLLQFDDARVFLMRASAINPHDDEIFFSIGEGYAISENWEVAVKYFKRAISIEDSREEYFAALAQAYAQTGNKSKACWAFGKAVAIAPEETQYWTLYIAFLFDSSDFKKAIHVIEEAEEATLSTEITYAKCVYLLYIGKRKEAMYWLGEALLEEFDLYPTLFELNPGLKEDLEVVQMIEHYRY